MIITVTLNPAMDMTLEVDSCLPGEVNRAVATQKVAGGKGINVSRTLRVMGEPTTALTVIGSDSVREFQRLAREAGVTIVYISIPGEIRTNIHIVDRSTGMIIKVNQPGVPLADVHFDHFKMLYHQQLKTARMVALGGSLPPGRPTDCYRTLVELAHKRDVPALVDAVGPPLLESLAGRPFIAKPNHKELEDTLGREMKSTEEITAGARELVDAGAECALISDGANPLIAVRDGIVYTVKPPHIAAKGTTGAGDALAAGVMSELIKGSSFPDALVYGVAVAAATCMTEEGELARPQDIARLRKKVAIRSRKLK